MGFLFSFGQMVRSTDNRTQAELLTEFDHALGGLSLKTEKPTTYRKKDVVIITLPSGVKISEVLTDLGRPLGERYFLILSNFYVRGLLRKKVAGQQGNFLRAHRDTLRRLGGERYRKLIDYGLKQGHFIKSPKPFIQKIQAYEYRINSEVLSLKNQQRYELTTVAAVRIRKADLTKRKTDFAKTSEVHQKIVQSIDGLTFDYSAAIKFVASLPDGETKDHRKNVIGLFLVGETEWTTDKQGRNYTLMVSVPRNLRRFFSYGNQPLWVADISSSQPLLHALLYPSDCDEKKKYLTIVEEGRFWEFMNDANGGTVDLDDPDERSEFKVQVFREVFFSYPESKKGVTKTFAVIFKREFPVLWSEMNARKLQRKMKAAGPLAKAMQQTEAEAVFDAVLTLKDKPYPLITIHDAIVTTDNGVADVLGSINESFAPVGLNPPLSVKRLTYTPTDSKKVAKTTG